MLHVIAMAFSLWGLAVLPAQASEAQTDDGKSPLSAEKLWELKRFSSPAVSPDGAQCALVVTHYDVEKDKGFSDIWLVPTTPGEARQLTTHISDESGPVWSPDGKWIAFVAKRDEDKANQVYVIPTDGGEARRVTNVPTGASGPKWFADSRRILFMSRVWPDCETWEAMEERQKEREESKVSAKVWDATWIRYWDHWIDDREAHLYITDIDGTDPNPVTLETGLQLSRSSPEPDGYDVSPDGEHVAMSADIDESGVDPNFDIFLIPLDGGEPENITTDNPADDTSPLYSPSGDRLAFRRQKIKGFYADRQRLMLYDLSSKQSMNCTESWDRSASGLLWAPDGNSLYGAIDDEAHNRVYRLPAGEGTPTKVTNDKTISSLSLSGDGKVLVGLQESFTQPPTLVRINTKSGETTKLSTFNDELLADIDFGSYESVAYTGANGDEIQMWINYPPGFDPAKKWPVYLLIHGGPHGAVQDSFHWRWNAQVFSSWGCVTAWHNFHGSSGFGQAFCDSINPEWAEAPYRDTIAAAEFLKERPWVDADRLAAGGGSYGGYLSAVILGREHPFQTLICHAGVFNLYTQYGADYAHNMRRFGEHWENPDVFERNSPHWAAGAFDTPTLIIHGQKDYRVPVNHGIEMFNTLQKRGVRSRLIYYPDENHWILKPQNSIHWYQAKRDWLAEFIGAGPTE